ncbi:MAG: NAD/NADP octopine/nopaline dehydrogenase family protein [Arcanobacterium sp.]|nr:NAD/NADP octopine/nopaline dehydrogenase family protein [Arcanobacterium sp.]
MARIGIVGGGHTGTVYAAYLAHRGHSVVLYTHRPEQWSSTLTLEDKVAGERYEAELKEVTSNPAVLAAETDMIFVTLPVYALGEFSHTISRHISPKHTFYLSPGNSAREYEVKPLVERGAAVVGLERVVFISRAICYGHAAVLSGTKPELVCGVLGGGSEALESLEQLFNIPVRAAQSYFPISLGASNPILHSSRLRALVGSGSPDREFKCNPMFYETWDTVSSQYFFEMDEERIRVARAYPELGGENVVRLTDYYESSTPDALTKKISGIPAFAGISSPMRRSAGGFRMDYGSRYFTEDIAFGLAQISQLGAYAQIPTPHIDAMLSWAFSLMDPSTKRLQLRHKGIDSYAAVVSYYLR